MELKELFQMYDKDGNEYIDAFELYEALCVSGTIGDQSRVEHKAGADWRASTKLTRRDVDEIFSSVDLDSDHKLN